jgi:uncharacterized protein YdhG (YjbR/CyaY superfamily)
MKPETANQPNPKLVANSLRKSLEAFQIQEVEENILVSHRTYFLFKNNHLTGGEYKPKDGSTPPAVVIYVFPDVLDQDNIIEELYQELEQEAQLGVIPELLKEKFNDNEEVFSSSNEWEITLDSHDDFVKNKDIIKKLLKERLEEVRLVREENRVQHTRQHEFLHAFDYLKSLDGPLGKRPITSELLYRSEAGNISNKIKLSTPKDEWKKIKDCMIDFCDMQESYKTYPNKSFMSEVMTNLHDRFLRGKKDGINQEVKFVDQNTLKALIIIQESVQYFSKAIQELGLEPINHAHKLIDEGISQYITENKLDDQIRAIKDKVTTTSSTPILQLTRPSSSKSHHDQFLLEDKRDSLEEAILPSSGTIPVSARSLPDIYTVVNK